MMDETELMQSLQDMLRRTWEQGKRIQTIKDKIMQR